MNMKSQLLLFMSTVLFIWGCRKSDIDTVQTVSLTVQLGYNTEDSALGLSKANIPVKITNLVSGQDYTANTNADGVAVFANIAPGNYTISASNNLTAEQYQIVTGIAVGSNVAFNATETQAVNVNSNVKLQLQSGRVGDLVFKQIYYAGSNTSTGAVFRDQFVEIYNNSNQTIYLDSLYVGNTEARTTSIATGGVPIDWRVVKEGMPTNIGDVNKDYLYFRHLFMIPGTGKQHPLEPGKSFVIAQTALNHTQPYTMNNGVVQGITNPALTVDLASADYETYLVDYKRLKYSGTTTFSPYRWDVDNPSIPNVTVVNALGSNDWAMDTRGTEDFIIFKAPGKDIISLPIYSPTLSGTNPSIQVPITVSIIDAVELVTPLETNRAPKRLPVSLDAAGTFVTGGQYSSQSLIRKTVKTVEGRRILQDTNNSANDFETKTKADPSKSAASFEK